MTRDPGAATGQPIREPKRCLCADLEPVHVIKADGSRGECSNSACGCREFRPDGRGEVVLTIREVAS